MSNSPPPPLGSGSGIPHSRNGSVATLVHTDQQHVYSSVKGHTPEDPLSSDDERGQSQPRKRGASSIDVTTRRPQLYHSYSSSQLARAGAEEYELYDPYQEHATRPTHNRGASYATLPSHSRQGSYATNPLGIHHQARSSSPTLAKIIQKEEILASRPDVRLRDRFKRRGDQRVGFLQSLKAIAFSSWLNLFVIFIPLAWIAHFSDWKGFGGGTATFILCFFALVPLESLFEWGGKQLSLYFGKQLGDLITVTLNNCIEATLAIVLLVDCELKLLQSTIVGVIVLHLLLIPGAAWATGGARIMYQDLHAHTTQLNQTLLIMGVLSLLFPAAFFSALDHGIEKKLDDNTTVGNVVTDETRANFLAMSRGFSIILLVVYVCSRIYLHNPPGPEKALHRESTAPLALVEEEIRLREKTPKTNPYVLIVVLLICIGIMAPTTQFLVHSVEDVREQSGISLEFFGTVLLPLVSFAANGFVAILYFIRYILRHFFHEPAPPVELAEAKAIETSVQFILFWMPFLVLLGWVIRRPITLLFDSFEIAVLLGACFVVNYVTADAKTNWVEGLAMIALYLMIALSVWFYKGQPEVAILLSCDSVEHSIEKIVSGISEHH